MSPFKHSVAASSDAHGAIDARISPDIVQLYPKLQTVDLRWVTLLDDTYFVEPKPAAQSRTEENQSANAIAPDEWDKIPRDDVIKISSCAPAGGPATSSSNVRTDP